MAKVALKSIDKVYDKKTEVIKNLNLEIQDKEFLVLVGPSGCGKSTLLRMIAGLEDITDGELAIGNRVVNKVHPKDRDIAMVFQNYALYPHMTVFENLAFGLKMRKFKKEVITERVEEAAKILNLEDLLDRKPKQLSGGQRQRVALGRAIVREPQVFLMDEPLSNLDAKLRVQMRFEIKKLHRKLQTTFVYVTHDQVEAMTMGDRIVVMNKGVIQQVGTPDEIYNTPENIFVAGFIGSPAMNFTGAKILEDNSIKIKDIVLKPDESLKSVIEKHSLTGKEVIAGIRPEYLSAKPLETGEIKIIPDLIEMLGSEKLVHFHLGERKVIAKLPSETDISPSKDCSLWINIPKILLFEKESGKRFK